jgi:hypothetical protein
MSHILNFFTNTVDILVDSWFVLTQTGYGKCIKKEFIAAHAVTHIYYRSDEWVLTILLNNKKSDISVSHKYYDDIFQDKQVNTVYRIGRISGNIYLDSIE